MDTKLTFIAMITPLRARSGTRLRRRVSKWLLGRPPRADPRCGRPDSGAARAARRRGLTLGAGGRTAGRCGRSGGRAAGWCGRQRLVDSAAAEDLGHVVVQAGVVAGTLLAALG